MCSFRYCTAAIVVVLSIADPAAADPTPGRAGFTVFLRGAQIGRADVDLARTPDGWTISSTGRLAPPVDLTTTRLEIRYGADWQPIELRIDAAQGGRPMTLSTSFGLTTAINEISQDDRTTAKTDQITARTIVLPTNFFGAYEALAARLAVSRPGDELRAYVAPQGEVALGVGEVSNETIRTPDRAVAVRHFRVTFRNPGRPLDADVWVDDRSRLARLEIAAAALQVVRDELSTIAARKETISHPGDQIVSIPASGFMLAATITRPPGPASAARLRLPAVVLIGGSGPIDRDETVDGIPIFAELAGALADAGFIVARFDKRGAGRSGGRLESATLADFAEDARAVTKYLSKRADVDRRRIAAVGHSEGGWVALIAASRDKALAAVALVAAPGTTGAELILEQQQRVLERLDIPDADKRAKIELQKKIQSAVLTGSGWEGVPTELRKQADTPWFQSVLAFDPARATPRVRQPIFVIQGALDDQVPPHHAARLGDLANARKNAPRTEVAVVDGVNHMLVQPQERTISRTIVNRLADWLKAMR